MVDVAMVPVGVRDSSAVHVTDMFQHDDAHILTAWNKLVGRLLAPTSGQSPLLCQMKIKSAASG
jgi:hypothetical protein